MTVLVTGDRHWTALRPILARLRQLPPGTRILHGAARGVDRLAETAAQILDLPTEPFPVTDEEWARLGPKAGPLRNRRMLDCRPDLVLAFHPDLTRSKGTRDCVTEARRRGIPVEVISA